MQPLRIVNEEFKELMRELDLALASQNLEEEFVKEDLNVATIYLEDGTQAIISKGIGVYENPNV